MINGRSESSDRCSAPLLTWVVAGMTVLISVVAQLQPAVMAALIRDRPALLAGQWWRAFTPLLVQPDGWGQLAFNLLGIALVGAVAQRQVENWMWLAAYVVGGVGSIAIYGMWHPTDTGGGSSAAVATLIGLLVSTAAIEPRPARSVEFAHGYAVFFAVYLTMLDLGGVTPAVVAGNGAIILTAVGRRVWGAAWLIVMSGVVVLIAGVAMTVMRDDHGTGLLIGVAAGTLTRGRHRRGPRQ